MTQARSKKTQLLDTATPEDMTQHMEELTGGIPSDETQTRLAQEEITQPISDADFFDYCTMVYERKGKAIQYYIKKNGKYVTTLKPPLDWDKLRSLFGSGHYTVQCKDELTNAFLKQKSEVLDELPNQDTSTAVDPNAPPFAFGGSSSSSDSMTALMAMMQEQNAQRAASEREQRIRDEATRREDREREEVRRREDRESKNDLMKTLIGVVPLLLPLVMPKKDDKLDTLVDFMKDNAREAQRQSEKMLERLERAQTDKKDALNPLELIRLLNESKKDGQNEMKEMLDMVEERAAERAAQMGDGDKEESTLALLIKNLGPGLAALMAQNAGAAAAAQTLPAPIEESVEVEPVEPVQAARAAAPPKSKDELDQEVVLKTLFPFFAEQLARIQNKVAVDPVAAARESLNLLKAKGFSQDRVLALFNREILFGVLRTYNIPKEHDSWFNRYYESLLVKESEQSSRKSAKVESLVRTKPRTSDRDNAREPVRNVGSPSANAGFIPATQVTGSGVESGKNAGAHPEVPGPLSS